MVGSNKESFPVVQKNDEAFVGPPMSPEQLKEHTREQEKRLKLEVFESFDFGDALFVMFSEVTKSPPSFPAETTKIAEALMEGLANQDSLYLALQDNFRHQKKYKEFPKYLVALREGIAAAIAASPDTSQQDIDNLNSIKDSIRIIERQCQGGSSEENLFTKKIEKYVGARDHDLDIASANLYQTLGLDPDQIRRDPRVFLELGIRREFAGALKGSAWTWKGFKSRASESGQAIAFGLELEKGEKYSLGPIQIRPGAYLSMILERSGVPLIKDKEYTYDECVELATQHNVTIPDKEELTQIFINPESVPALFAEMLAFNIPKPGEPIRITLDLKDGKGNQRYELPLQSTYTFLTNEGQEITYTHDEMRLMEGLGNYQAGGLRLGSKDSEVPIEEGLIASTKTLILNNRVINIAQPISIEG